MTWNDYVRYQAAAARFMGLDAPSENLGFPFLPGPAAPTPGKSPPRRRRPCAARPPAPQQQGHGPLFDRARLHAPPRTRAQPAPVRAPALRPYSLFARRQLTADEKEFRSESDRLQAEFAHLRPLNTMECAPGMPKAIRPCPWGCKFNLLFSVNANGSLKVDHGHLDPSLLEETCALDVAAKHKEGVTQERTAVLTGVTEDRIRQVERGLMKGLRRAAKPLRGMVTEKVWAAPDASGRQTCIPCKGEGVLGPYGEEIPCVSCEGDGYRWADAN